VVVTDGRTIVMERNLQQALKELVSRKGGAAAVSPPLPPPTASQP